MTSGLAHFGAGHSGIRFLLRLLLWLTPLTAEGQPSSTEWTDAAAWPVSRVVEARGDASLLVIVEQAGVDLRARLAGGELVNAPLGRMGPDFVYVPRGETVELKLEPLYPFTEQGRFRLTYLPLTEGSTDALGRALTTAGRDYGSGDPSRQARACADYRHIAEAASPDQDWQNLARLLAAKCYFATGQEVPPLLLQSIAAPSSFPTVLPYHLEWLRAEISSVQIAHETARRQVTSALQQAMRALADMPELERGIRHDVAEMQSLLGGNAALAAYIAGGGDDDSHDALARKERLLDESQRSLDAAIAAALELGDAYIAGRAYDFLAALHYVRNEQVGVIENLEAAKQQLEKTGMPVLLLPILGSIGDFHKRWGELRAAQAAYLEALRIVDGNSTDGRYADAYENAGTFYYDLGDFARARSHIETSIRLSKQTGRETRAYHNMRRLAMILEREGDYQAAQALNEEALAYFEREDAERQARSWSPYRIMTQSALSRIRYALGELDDALRLSDEALAQVLSRSIEPAADLPSVYVNHANILSAMGQRDAALQMLDRTIEKYSSDPIAMVNLLAAKMELLQRSAATEEAVSVASRVFETIENERTELDAVRLGPSWSGRTNEIYASHIDYLLTLGDRGHAAAAFEVAERARATSLRLRRMEMLLQRNETNDEARAEWITIQSELEKSHGAQRTEEDRLAFERRLTEARERYFAAQKAPLQGAQLASKSIDELEAQLPPNTALLEFVTGSSNFWRFDIWSDGWSVTSLGKTPEVRTAINAALYEISNPYVRDRQSMEALSARLLGDLAFDPSGKTLLISPSNGLNAFPFAALQIDGEHLADVATITLVPSFSGYFADSAIEQNTRSGDRLDLALLADPAFDGAMTLGSLAGNSEVFRDWAGSLQRLPASAVEARELARYYAEDRRLVLTGEDATQRNFFDSRVRNAKVIHIATHGYFNEEIPDLIGFAMAKTEPDDDGFVSMAEISSQDFAAELVVISACSTGRGFEVAGEGNMSLARTFLAQGVDAVVSTLWPVSDTATALFMKEFYRAVNEENRSLDQALSSAQQVLRRTDRFRSPFYWSGYTLTMAARPRQ